jgi:hypothetical protein
MTIFKLTGKQKKFWNDLMTEMKNHPHYKVITRPLRSPIPLPELAEYIKWEIEKIKEELENGKNETEDEKES